MLVSATRLPKMKVVFRALDQDHSDARVARQARRRGLARAEEIVNFLKGLRAGQGLNARLDGAVARARGELIAIPAGLCALRGRLALAVRERSQAPPKRRYTGLKEAYGSQDSIQHSVLGDS